MLLEKDGITVELTHPQDIQRHLALGYKEVKPTVKKKAVSKKASK